MQPFFSLIRLSLGIIDGLPFLPTEKDWKEFFDLAKQQGLIGICFVGIQKLPPEQRPPQAMYLRWLGMTAEVQQRNENLNQQCLELHDLITQNGFQSCVLKGQISALLYGELAPFRQSGDIDIWIDAPIKEVINVTKQIGEIEELCVIHISTTYKGTHVEPHFLPVFRKRYLLNKKIQTYCLDKLRQYNQTRKELLELPSWEFNAVYSMVHNYTHIFSHGIELRHLMDYYFILKTRPQTPEAKIMLKNITTMLKELELERFSAAIMWVMKEIFLLEDEYLIAQPNEKLGKQILEDIQRGWHEIRDAHGWHKRFLKIVRRLRWLRYFPLEVLNEPFWKIHLIITNFIIRKKYHLH